MMVVCVCYYIVPVSIIVVVLVLRVDSGLVLKVTTLVEQMQQLRNMKFTSSVHDAFMRWADTTRRVDACRRDEIANAINRHRTKNASQTEKDKGFSLHIFLHAYNVAFIVVYENFVICHDVHIMRLFQLFVLQTYNNFSNF